MYGPVPRMLPSSIGVIGVPLGTGQLNGIVRRARNEAGGSVSLKVIVLPSTVMPDTASALPAIKASAPSIAVKKPPPGDAIGGLSIRSKVYLMSAPVMGAPPLNLTPSRSLKTYVV